MDWGAREKAFDKSNVKEILEGFPGQCINGYNIGKSLSVSFDREIRSVFVTGMGGSGFVGHMLKDALKKEIKIPITVNNEYSLPGFVNENTLVVAVSYSGNTEETIQALEKAIERNAIVVGCCSGGKLAELCKLKSIVPSGMQPRMSIGCMFFAVLGMLGKMQIIEKKEKELEKLLAFLEKEKNFIIKETRKLSLELTNFFPVFYSTEAIDCLGKRFQNDLNENAKVLAHSQVIPEMNHNEINSENFPERSCAIFLHTSSETEKIWKRIAFTKTTLEKNSVKCIEIEIKGRTILEQLCWGTMFSLFLSFFLAIVSGKDPEPVPVIAELKRFLAEKEVVA